MTDYPKWQFFFASKELCHGDCLSFRQGNRKAAQGPCKYSLWSRGGGGGTIHFTLLKGLMRGLKDRIILVLCLSSTDQRMERTNQTLEQYIWCFTFVQDDWASLLSLADFAYNNASHSSTGQSPFFTNYSFRPSFLPELLPEFTLPAFQSMVDFLNRNNKLLQEAMSKAQVDNESFW